MKLTFLLVLCAIGFAACDGTVAPFVKRDTSVEVYGNVVSKKPYIVVTKDGYVLNDQMRDEYNSLIDSYAKGTTAFAINPPLVKDVGIKAITSGSWAGYWLQDGQHQIYYRDMRDWNANGIKGK